MNKTPCYRIIYISQSKRYEIYATRVEQSEVFGFVEISGLVFGEKSSMVVDPTEETLKAEYEGVNRSLLPAHSILRIDEVNQRGNARITDSDGDTGSVTPFPGIPPKRSS